MTYGVHRMTYRRVSTPSRSMRLPSLLCRRCARRLPAPRGEQQLQGQGVVCLHSGPERRISLRCFPVLSTGGKGVYACHALADVPSCLPCSPSRVSAPSRVRGWRVGLTAHGAPVLMNSLREPARLVSRALAPKHTVSAVSSADLPEPFSPTMKLMLGPKFTSSLSSAQRPSPPAGPASARCGLSLDSSLRKVKRSEAE
jgi:hypothetical protein